MDIDFRKLAKTKRAEVTLPAHRLAIAKSLTKRPDLEDEVILAFEKRRYELLLPVNHKWWTIECRKVWKKANLPTPSNGKIIRMRLRANITLQRVRDHKPLSVADRIDKVRAQLSRLDEFQRQGVKDPIFGRLPPSMMFGADEFSGVMFPHISTTYNKKGSKSCQVRRPAGLETRQMSVLACFRYEGQQLGKIFVVLPLAPTEICNAEGEVVKWDVTTPKSPMIKREIAT